ncbi:muconate/chloromuconate family cycloisomerase [Bradyrhizobium sp. Ce-3]|uniref:muconate/chloromuconate family cycloisomerase n=1 Tax=Bradyrhizobium sp. Ce-3 TaxID=2913970 RepID=UPI001FB9FD2A|nr:muconate/chloromuconate family cycloisomerase [Bradyrhizobium sp. Ce-3]GKQ49621.1 muconate cycloisomerase [Bradyrhizobium sp. Ce-3]
MSRAVIEIAEPVEHVRGLTRDTAVRSIRATIVEAPTRRRHKLSNTEVTHQGYVLVRVQLDNGVTGIGEASTLGGPRWAEESVESIKAAVTNYLAPALLGQPALAFEANALRMSKAATRNFAAKGAIESALLDAAGKTLGLPASALLGGAVRERMEVIWALASGDSGQELEEAKEKLRRREHRQFKIKFGFNRPQADLKRLQTLRAGLGDEVRLIVDVNQGWTEAECIRFMPALEELDVALIEQPVSALQLEAMVRVAARTSIPLLVDEAAFTKEEIARVATMGCGSVYSLKLVKSGGLFEIKRAAAVAGAHGLELYGGCLLESSIGAAAHLAAFATLPKLEWGTEHFGPRILVEDLVVNPIRFDEFEICVPDGPGLGVEVDEDRIRAFARKD